MDASLFVCQNGAQKSEVAMSTYLVVLDGARADSEVQASLARIKGADDNARFTVLVPADRRKYASEGECWLDAAQRANEALETLKSQALDVAEAIVGDFMRRKAISEELRRAEHAYDEVLLFTTPFRAGMDVSRLVPSDIAVQLERRHRVPVRHTEVGAKTPSLAQPRFSRRLLVQKYETLSRRN
jgi:hypothetical protein